MLNPIVLFQTARLKQELLKLRTVLNDISKIIIDTKTEIKTCITEVETEIPELISKHYKLLTEVNKKNTKPDEDIVFNFYKQKEEEKLRKIDDDTKIKCKELYKEIAKKTHPDLINDELLNNIFKEAVDKYEEYDYVGLLSISKQLNTNNISKTIFEKLDIDVNKLNEEIDELNKQINIKKDEIFNIKASVGYKVLQCFKNENEYSKLLAEQIYSSFIISENVKLLQELSK